MTRKLKLGLGATGALTAGALGSWRAGSLLQLQGRDLWILRGGLFLLAAILVAGMVYVLWHRRASASSGPADAGQEIDLTVAAARARLAASRLGRSARLSDLPVVLLLGPGGSAKTTTVVRSGLDPELLAGEVFRGDSVTPTRGINVWYSEKTIFAEAGSKVTADSARWARLVSHLQPRRLRSALSGRTQPPRVAVVCFSCEELMRPDSAESVPSAARTLRARLAELALSLGVRLPVYVVFTKADKIPHFPEYVRNFSRDETREVFGTTLPLDAGGTDPEKTYRRIDRAFQRMFHSLASKRLKFLPRESLPEHSGSAYEFPREFRKAIPVATQFLVELCRPSQLEISLVLRGFYLVGVRPVVVGEVPFEPVTRAAATEESLPIGATSVFGPGRSPAVAMARLSEPAATSRKVPQWLFLERLFPEVVLGDQVALALTAGGRRVDLLRRMLLTAAAAAAAVAALGFSASYAGNRKLQLGVAEALRGVRVQSLGGEALASPEALRRLDRLRGELTTLARYEREGAPWNLRWGLYAGSALYPGARRQYFTTFERLLLAGARDSLAVALRTLPASPTPSSDYGQAYTALKAYLIATSNPDKSTAEFLAPVLTESWHGATPMDAGRAELARRQFEFYAEEIPRANPYAYDPEARTIAHAREYLRQFTGSEPIYRSMLAAVASTTTPVEFARSVPGSAGLIHDSYVVPGPFTRAGWKTMQAAFADVDRFFKGDAWVIGDQAPLTADRAKVRTQLQARYTAEYVDHWRRFLAAAAVERFGGVSEGARRLAPLSSNQSPLLGLFALVSRHTSVDSVAVAPAFQPVQVVAPPGDSTRYVGPSNEAYVNAMVALQASLEQIAKGTPDEANAAVGQALGDASQAKLATKQLANQFRLDEAGKVHLLVQRLMEAPILYVEAALQTVGPAALNGKGKAFCAPFRQLLTKFPFNSYGREQAGVDEVGSLLQPSSGMLWTFVQEDLGNYVTRQGIRFNEKPGSPVRISPSFLAFLSRAAEFSNSLYRGEGTPAALRFTLRPILSDAVPAMTVTVDGRPVRFTRTSAAAKLISWSAEDAQEAGLSAQVGGRELEVFRFPGTWGLFKLFHQAEWFSREGEHAVEWRIPAQAGSPSQRVTFDVQLAGDKPILKRDFFSGVSCSGRITR